MTSRGNIASQKSSVRLVELGPRISMELLKIEEGMLDGETLYHKHITKTDEEKKEIKRIIEKRKKEKAQRKQVQFPPFVNDKPFAQKHPKIESFKFRKIKALREGGIYIQEGQEG